MLDGIVNPSGCALKPASSLHFSARLRDGEGHSGVRRWLVGCLGHLSILVAGFEFAEISTTLIQLPRCSMCSSTLLPLAQACAMLDLP